MPSTSTIGSAHSSARPTPRTPRRRRSPGTGAGVSSTSVATSGSTGSGTTRSGASSVTATTTTVMLSSPPALLAASTSCVAARVGIGLAPERGGDVVGLHHAGEPVGAEQDAIAGHELDRVHVDVDRRVDAERTRDDRSLRVHRGFLGGELALADELLDQAVVVGDLAELAVVQQVRARVADVTDEQGAAARERRPR